MPNCHVSPPLSPPDMILPYLQRDRMKIYHCQRIQRMLFFSISSAHTWPWIIHIPTATQWTSRTCCTDTLWWCHSLFVTISQHNFTKTIQRACRHNAALYHEELRNCQSNESLTAVFGEYTSLNLLFPKAPLDAAFFRSVSFIPGHKLGADSQN